MSKNLIVDPSEYDLDCPIESVVEIRRRNPQRFELEQLSAIVLNDPQRGVCVGYKDLAHDEFWVKGHMPGMPLMPGVLMCEAAAQLASYFVQKHDLLGAEIIGLGGLEDVRFRGIVRPGDRLVIAVKLLKVRRGAMISCQFQEFVNQQVVCEGILKGIPLPSEFLMGKTSAAAAPNA